jgi:hypothetical protein
MIDSNPVMVMAEATGFAADTPLHVLKLSKSSTELACFLALLSFSLELRVMMQFRSVLQADFV